jgi:muramoyltetrapeptide carboxypeptidase
MESRQTSTRIKPPALCAGDTVGIVAPASPLDRAQLEAGCQALRGYGFNPIYLPSILERDGFFAGSIERRARELEEMYVRDDVRAILCARGGYGCSTLLRTLNLDIIKAHPKILMGYSDVTTLLTWITDAANQVTFHGPMVSKDFAAADGVDGASWLAATAGEAHWKISGADLKVLAQGKAEGMLYGGCLSMIVASLGTPYESRTENTILFMEDVSVKPYQIHRMMMQLQLAGKLAGVRGLIFGEMKDCMQPGDPPDEVTRTLQCFTEDQGIPVAYGLRSGHVTRSNITLPLGVRAALQVTDTVELTILEAACEARNAHSSS